MTLKREKRNLFLLAPELKMLRGLNLEQTHETEQQDIHREGGRHEGSIEVTPLCCTYCRGDYSDTLKPKNDGENNNIKPLFFQ